MVESVNIRIGMPLSMTFLQVVLDQDRSTRNLIWTERTEAEPYFTSLVLNEILQSRIKFISCIQQTRWYSKQQYDSISELCKQSDKKISFVKGFVRFVQTNFIRPTEHGKQPFSGHLFFRCTADPQCKQSYKWQATKNKFVCSKQHAMDICDLRYKLNFVIQDYSGETMVIAFDKQAEELLGLSETDLAGKTYAESVSMFEIALNNIRFTRLILMIEAKSSDQHQGYAQSQVKKAI